MQDYRDIANKNGVELNEVGPCQFCGAQVTRGIHECVEIFNVGFSLVDFSMPENHIFRFFIVDAHTLQHPEIHGRWSNHFHLTRLHLIFKYKIYWSYQLSPLLSDTLNDYKRKNLNEFLSPPKVGKRGNINSEKVSNLSKGQSALKLSIEDWAREVYQTWKPNWHVVDKLALEFRERHTDRLDLRVIREKNDKIE